MSNEPRKASDILLSLESKIDQLISLYRNQDLVLKVLANKLNNLIDTVNNLPVEQGEISESNTSQPPQIMKISAEASLPVEVSPRGFRRTSRPETYDTEMPQPPPIRVMQKTQPTPTLDESINLPVQFPEFTPVISTPSPPVQVKKPKVEPAPQPMQQNQVPSTGKIPVEQRVVDKNGKAVFLANVELLNANGEVEYKTRTNGVGKWQASLSVGKYQVKINKQESVSKEKLDLVQDITVDGLSVTQTLPVLICR